VKITLTVNDRQYPLDIEPRRILADVLREDCELTGTHLGCEQGVCGACTVVVDGQPVRSCLMLAVQCDGAAIRTVEGLVGPDGQPSAIQRAFSAERALQCGFCTPGFLMVADAALQVDPALGNDPDRVGELVGSNLCRCTGYEPIHRAITRASEELQQGTTA
jgi:aerobic carbon-monoxide dehydrogenase small subunit